jgi:hypothetical protein
MKEITNKNELIGMRVGLKCLLMTRSNAGMPMDLEADELFFIVAGFRKGKVELIRQGSSAVYECELEALRFESSIADKVDKMFKAIAPQKRDIDPFN